MRSERWSGNAPVDAERLRQHGDFLFQKRRLQVLLACQPFVRYVMHFVASVL